MTRERKPSWSIVADQAGELGAACVWSGLTLGLLFYWYAVADRYAVFLYGHLGATPFDEVTSSRYWMAGLVAGGVVVSATVAANWLLGRLSVRYVPTDWPRLWRWAGPVTFAGAALICLFGGKPALPIGQALACGAASAAALGLALSPARLAARDPLRLMWYSLHGLAMAPVLMLLRALELPGRLQSVSATAAVAASVGGLAASAVLLAILAVLGRRRGWAGPGTAAVLASGFAVAYLLFPLAHHFLATPASFRYITASANFFAQDWRLQVVVWAAAALLADASARLGRRL